MEHDPRWGQAPVGGPAHFGQAAPGRPPTLDMTPDGGFRDVPAIPVGARVIGLGLLVAVAAGTLAVAALALWFAMMLVPVAIGAALVAYGAFKVRQWRMGGSFRGNPLAPRGPFR